MTNEETKTKRTRKPRTTTDSDEPYPEQLCEDMDPAKFKSDMAYSSENYQCFYCKQNCSGYEALLDHVEANHADLTSDPNQSVWMTVFTGHKPPRRPNRKRTTPMQMNNTKKKRRKSGQTMSLNEMNITTKKYNLPHILRVQHFHLYNFSSSENDDYSC